MRALSILAGLFATLAAMPAAAQVRVMIDGKPQDVPAGVIRTVTYAPGGRQAIRDEPFAGTAAPGAATITTTETTDEDDAGRVLRTEIVTRIEPIAMTAVAMQAGFPVQPMPAFAVPPQAPAPQLALDTSALDADEPAGDGQPLRLRRDAMTGHFIAPVRINGVVVRAIVDTGAQETVLSAEDAHATGADRDITRATPMTGIGGMTMLNVTRVRSMEVAGQQLGGFSACIGQQGIPYTLLGQTEIARLGRIVIEDGVMTITPRARLQMAMR